MLYVMHVQMIRGLRAVSGGYWYEPEFHDNDGLNMGQGVRLEFEDEQYPETLMLTIKRQPEMALDHDGKAIDVA